MNQKITYPVYGLIFLVGIFLAWEWMTSYPKVRIVPLTHPESQTEKIDSVLIQSLVSYSLPGIAAGLISEGEISYLKSFGYQNLETKDSLKLDSKLPVGSVSKLFVALTVANYGLEQGWNLHTPAEKIIPIPSKEITLGHLLTHTSGLKSPNLLNQLIRSRKSLPLDQIGNSKLDFSGALNQKNYADINFDLLGHLLEKSSKTSFNSLSLGRIFEKGGMKQTYFEENTSLSVPAQGYCPAFPWRRIKKESFHLPILPSPSSGMITSAEDLSKFMLHLSRGEMSDFSDELDWLTGDAEIPAGFQSIKIGGKTYVGHFGEQGGFSAFLFFSKNWDTGIFLITNSRDHADFRIQIASAILQILTQPS